MEKWQGIGIAIVFTVMVFGTLFYLRRKKLAERLNNLGGGGGATAWKTETFNRNRTSIISKFDFPMPVQTRTAGGALVMREAAPDRTYEQVYLDAIERGINRTLAKTENKGYQNYRKISDFRIAIVADTIADSAGDLCIKTKVIQGWAGTDFDKGGFMTIAGIVLGLEDGALEQPCIFIGDGNTPEFIEETISNEVEHYQAYFNDKKFFDETKFVHSHPMYPELNKAVSFFGAVKKKALGCVTG